MERRGCRTLRCVSTGPEEEGGGEPAQPVRAEATTRPATLPFLNDVRTLTALLQEALAITQELNVEKALSRIVDAAREITGARYAACGAPGETRFLHFIYSEISAAEDAAIGGLPQSKGLLGALLTEKESIRADDLHTHPLFAGFPAHHPSMTSFLGVPILYRGRNIGNIYLTNKVDGTVFNKADQRAVEVLAGFASVSLTNAYQFLQVNEELEARRSELDSNEPDAARAVQPDPVDAGKRAPPTGARTARRGGPGSWRRR